jgi:hypothetical protein
MIDNAKIKAAMSAVSIASQLNPPGKKYADIFTSTNGMLKINPKCFSRFGV